MRKKCKSGPFALCWSGFSNGDCGSASGKRTFLLVSAAFLQMVRTQNSKQSGEGRVQGSKATVAGGGSSLTLHCSTGKKKTSLKMLSENQAEG